MAYKKKKIEKKEALRRGRIGEYVFFWWTERSPRTEERGKSGFGYKTTWKCPFLLPTKLGGGVGVSLGKAQRVQGNHRCPWRLAKLFSIAEAFHHNLSLSPCCLSSWSVPSPPPPILSQCLEAADGLLCLLRTQGISGEAFGCPTCL